MAGPILRIAAVDPSGKAALDDAALDAAADAVESADASVRVVLLDHPGPNFCFGGNVEQFAGADDPSATVRGAVTRLHRLVRALAAAPQPVLAGVRGWAAGAGMSLVCAADVVVAGESARLRPAYPGIGFSPDGGLTWTLPRIIGHNRALDVLLTNRVISAAEALSWGIVGRTVPDDTVADEIEALAESLAAGPAGAYAAIKRLVHDGDGARLADHLDAEADSIVERAGSADGLEGVRAFLDRRPARFGGSA